MINNLFSGLANFVTLFFGWLFPGAPWYLAIFFTVLIVIGLLWLVGKIVDWFKGTTR